MNPTKHIKIALRNYLKGLDLSPYGDGNRQQGTYFISSKIEEFARIHGLGCEREVSLGLKRTSGKQKGHIDFILTDPVSKTRIAVEIDSSNKKWSLTKLLHASEKRIESVWVRWHRQTVLQIPRCIWYIDLTKPFTSGNKNNSLGF